MSPVLADNLMSVEETVRPEVALMSSPSIKMEVVGPNITRLPEPIIFPCTANVADGVELAMPTYPPAGAQRVLVPTINPPAIVVVAVAP